MKDITTNDLKIPADRRPKTPGVKFAERGWIHGQYVREIARDGMTDATDNRVVEVRENQDGWTARIHIGPSPNPGVQTYAFSGPHATKDEAELSLLSALARVASA